MVKSWTFSCTQGGRCRGRLFCLVVLAGFVLIGGLAPPETVAQMVDPHSLLREWVGTWTWDSHVQSDYNMTVTKVEGSRVYGRVERAGFGSRVPAASFNFVGTLQGDNPVFAGSAPPGEFTIYKTNYGTTMKGRTVETLRFDVSMTKSK